MILWEMVQLKAEEDRNLRLWLGKSEFKTLISIISAKMHKHSAAALSSALEGNDSNLKFDAANADLRSAQKYGDCINILNDIVKQPVSVPFENSKLTQSC